MSRSGSTPGGWREALWCLRLVVAPLTVLGLGAALFELVAPDPYRIAGLFSGLIRAAGPAGSEILVAEWVSRTLWLSTAFLYITGSLLASALYAALAWRSARRAVLRVLAVTGVAGMALAWAGPAVELMAAGSERMSLPVLGSHVVGTLFWLSYDTLGTFYAVHARPESMVGPLLPFLINAAGTLGVIAAMVAGCAILDIGPGSRVQGLADLERRLLRLRYAVNAVSVQMLLGVLQIVAWLRWPATLLPDFVAPAEGSRLILSVSVYWGAVFTLAIVSFYLPALAALRRRAEQLLAETPGAAASADGWMREHGFTQNLRDMVPQVVTMLSPLIIAPVGSLLSGLAGPL